MNILIFSASTGGGHNRASNAMKEYFSKVDDNTVKIIDALEYSSKVMNFVITKGYKGLAMNLPELYGRLYHESDKESENILNDLLDFFVEKMAEVLIEAINKEKPDIIISTHAFVTTMLSKLKVANKISIPVVAIVTDFEPHRTYINVKIDAYITATQDTADTMVNKYGVDESIIYPYGIPIFERFYERNPKRIKETYKQLGFSEDKFTILIMAGSFGVKDILKIYENLASIDFDYQIIVITGKNKRLYDAFSKMLNKKVDSFDIYQISDYIDKLPDSNLFKSLFNQSDAYKKAKTETYKKHLRAQKPTKLFYYIDNVDDYMHISDMIITKPGGLTTSEAIACELPLAIFQAFPGQEEDNANFLVDKGIAIKLKKGNAGAKQIEHILNHPKRIMRMKDNCRACINGESCANLYGLLQRLANK